MEVLPFMWIATPETITLVPLNQIRVVWNFSQLSVKLPSGMYGDKGPKIVRIKEQDNYRHWEDMAYKLFCKSQGQVIVWSGDEKITLHKIQDFISRLCKDKSGLSDSRVGEWCSWWVQNLLLIRKINTKHAAKPESS